MCCVHKTISNNVLCSLIPNSHSSMGKRNTAVCCKIIITIIMREKLLHILHILYVIQSNYSLSVCALFLTLQACFIFFISLYNSYVCEYDVLHILITYQIDVLLNVDHTWVFHFLSIQIVTFSRSYTWSLKISYVMCHVSCVSFLRVQLELNAYCYMQISQCNIIT